MIAAALFAQLVLASPIVVDGDTLHDARRGQDYRLVGIDAPETLRAKCPAEKALGAVAAARVRELIAAAGVVTAIPARDPRGRKRWPVDGFKRRLARIELDGQDLGALLLREGVAAVYDEKRPRDWCEGATP